MRRLHLALAVLGFLSGPALADEARKPVAVTPLAAATATASGQPIMLPTGPAAVGVSRYVIEPGAKLAVHKHPNQRYAYVVAGTLAVYIVDTGERVDYKPGDFIVEVKDQWHYGENTGTVPVELLVIDQTPAGTTVNTVTRP